MIIDVVRTGSGKGKPGGALSQVHPATLLATALVALLDRNDFDPVLIDDVIVGCVTQSGEQSLNVGRTAVLAAGLSESVPAVTIDRQCGSGQQAAHFAAQGVMAGAYDVVIACGVESMSRAPMFSNTLGQDANGGPFANEIIPVQADDTSDAIFDRDETIRADTTPATLAGLPAAFHDPGPAGRFPGIGWHITAGNSSPLTDGASAALITSEEMAGALGLRPRARFHAFSVMGSDPLMMLTGPIAATEKVLKRVASLGASGTRILATLVNYLESAGGRYGLQTMCEGGGMANAAIIERL
jgi:acetyl-CoA acyltransferase